MKIDNTFNNPIGAVPPPVQSSVDGYSSTPLVDYENVYGRGGSVRHSGSFSPDNPAYQQLLAAQQGGGKNQDIDALYEKAVQWEIDNANTERQHAYEQAMRDEQREYEDPVNQLARQRAAGINPDVAGSGSGVSSGSSAPMSVSPRINTPTQTKFSNAYDNTSLVLDGIGTAASVISSFSGLAGTVVQGIDTLLMLPSNLKMAQAGAKVATESADSIIQQNKNSASSGKLQNISASIGILGEVSDMFTNESTDDSILGGLQAIGYSADESQQMLPHIRTYQGNDKMRAKYADYKKQRQELEAYNEAFTPEILGDIMNYTSEFKRSSVITDAIAQRMQLSINLLLSGSEDYTSGVAKNMIQSVGLESDALKLRRAQVQRDFKSFQSFLNANIRANKEIDVLIEGLRKDEKLPLRFQRIKALQVKKSLMNACGSNAVNQFYQVLNDTWSSAFMANQHLDNETGPLSMDDETMVGMAYFNEYTFGDFYNGSVHTNKLIDQANYVIDFALREQLGFGKLELDQQKNFIDAAGKGLDFVGSIFKSKKKPTNTK